MSYVSTVIADAPLHFWRAADGGGQLAHDLGSRPWTIHCGSLLLGYTGVNSDGGAMFCAGNNGSPALRPYLGRLSRQSRSRCSFIRSISRGCSRTCVTSRVVRILCSWGGTLLDTFSLEPLVLRQSIPRPIQIRPGTTWSERTTWRTSGSTSTRST